MTVETPQPREGDRVRVTPKPYEGELKCDGTQGRLIQVRDDEGRLNAFGPDYATVEVLERADDPSKSLRGEIREIDGMAAVCYGKNMWVYFSALHHGATGGYGVYKDAQMIGAPVIGVVPRSPAAEEFVPDWERELIEQESPARRSVRVENTPHGPSDHLRQAVSEHLTAGDTTAAVDLLVQRTTMDRKTAARYVQDMPGYQEPRVFRSDGPEPPAGVDRLEASHDIQGWTHVERDGEWWRWTSQNGRALGAQAWRNLAAHIEYREVV